MLALSVFAFLLASAAGINAAVHPSLNNTVEQGIETECKTCPYSLCTNKAYYSGGDLVTLTCYTHGTNIGGDNVWLKTTDGCYVTQYDLTNYNGTYEYDLKYCGSASEVEHLTKKPAKTKYDTECNIIPQIDSDTISYVKYGTDLTVTCWTDEGDLIINDSTWLKTTSNCYVAQIGLTSPANKASLDNCGPIPFLEVNKTAPVVRAISPGVKRRVSSVASKPEAKAASHQFQKRYLVNFTVGEDYAYCHSCAKESCPTVKKYEFNTGVRLQCYTENQPTIPNAIYWLLTTDFCWVRDIDFFESVDDEYKFPDCSLFK